MTASSVRRFGLTWALCTVLMAACALPQAGRETAPSAPKAKPNPSERYRTRPPINTTRNLYEGSLWRGAASWGNLMRDHRARYRGDLLTVIDLNKIIKVPDLKPEVPEAQQEQPEGQGGRPEDPILRALRAQQKRREDIDREQHEILRSIQSIEVEVVRVLANGNLLVRGTHPPVFRDRNLVKYIVTLRGIVRPSDVDGKNAIISSKLGKAEYRIRRFVKRAGGGRARRVKARTGGSTREGSLLSRFSNFLTTK